MNLPRPVARLSLNRPESADGYLTLSANYDAPGTPSEVLWFRVPEVLSGAIDFSINPFVTALFLKAAQNGHNLHVNGVVDSVLLSNIDSLLSVFNAWLPKTISRISITAESEVRRNAIGTDAVCCASGGLDSSYTIWRHTIGRAVARPEPLKAGIYVHGFDVSLEDELGAQAAMESVDAINKHAGIESIHTATNFRSVVPNWEITFGAAASATLSLFSNRFGRGLLASGGELFMDYAWGSTPTTDHLLSSSTMDIRCDAPAIRRITKTAEMASWNVLHEHLKVCWVDRKSGRNCGKCEKCIRTYYALLAAGAEHLAAFPRQPTVRDIHHIEFRHRFQIEFMGDIVALAELNGRGGEPWALALKTRVAHGRRELKGGGTGATNRFLRKAWRKLTT